MNMACERMVGLMGALGGRPPPTPWIDPAPGAVVVTPEPPLGETASARRGEFGPVGLVPMAPARIRSLLVPVDGSPFGEHALPHALGIARRSGAVVRVVHVHAPLESVLRHDPPHLDDTLNGWLRRQGQEYLTDLVRRLAQVAPEVPVIPAFREGRGVAASLVSEACAGIDLVVMATHGRGPLARLWFGSIAGELMRCLAVPLLLVRGSNAPADLGGDPLLRHVLVPLDGSAMAERVLEPAIALGTLSGAEYTLLRLVQPGGDGSVGPSGGRPAVAWGDLRRVADRLGGRSLRGRARLVRDERPIAEVILRYASAHDADLIALATRGRGGGSRWFRGCIADRVVRGAEVPVLISRPDGAPERTAEAREPTPTTFGCGGPDPEGGWRPPADRLRRENSRYSRSGLPCGEPSAIGWARSPMGRPEARPIAVTPGGLLPPVG